MNLINRDVLKRKYEYMNGDDDTLCECISILEDAPIVDAEPVRHGQWIQPTVIDGRAFNIPHCSVCNEVPCGVDEHTKYCPNCGAKMDGERKEKE